MRFALAICALLLISCSPQLHQVSVPHVESNVARKGENSEVYFRYLGREGDLLIFDLEVRNTSNEILYIDPERITMSAARNQHAAYSITPTDPHPLSGYDVGLRLKSKIKSHGAFQALIGAASAGLSAYSGMSFGESMFGQMGRDLVTTAGLFAGEIAVSSLDAKKDNLREDLAYVPDEILEKSTLRPDHTLQGKVFYDAIPKMSFYTFKVPIEGEVFEFHFQK